MRYVTRTLGLLLLLGLVGCTNEQSGSDGKAATSPIRLQLNWFHDPTFAGEYRAADQLAGGVTILEGGVNVSPVQRLKSGLADAAIVGADIALEAIAADLSSNRSTPLRIVFADFQRNPVGWIVHPAVVRKLGLSSDSSVSGRQRNDWLFDRFRDGSLRPGDKRGTETTAVWARWRQVRDLKGVKVTPVGFDATVVLGAPRLAYPVYMNEEPFKLAERIGEAVAVFDPADDGVVLLGNVVITTDAVLEKRRTDLIRFLNALQEAWMWVKQNPDSAASLVKLYYSNVSDPVLRSQIVRTTEFVFYGVDRPGALDTATGGRLDQTIDALRSAGSLSSGVMTLERVRQVVLNLAPSSP